MTVFIAGISTLAVEFTASRMLQTVYGTSNIVWASAIGLTLLFLTAGYFGGGRLADRAPSAGLFYWIVSAAGMSSVIFLLLTSYLLPVAPAVMSAAGIPSSFGSLIAATSALAIPVSLLGCVSPFAIRLGIADINEAGRLSGRIYAISTWGSLIGTYLPTMVTIPMLGSRLTAVVFGRLLIAMGIAGLARIEISGARTEAARTG